ncbi:hypothetical protein T08_12538, partial [Trichinella sp. T8]
LGKDMFTCGFPVSEALMPVVMEKFPHLKLQRTWHLKADTLLTLRRRKNRRAREEEERQGVSEDVDASEAKQRSPHYVAWNLSPRGSCPHFHAAVHERVEGQHVAVKSFSRILIPASAAAQTPGPSSPNRTHRPPDTVT